MKNTLRAIAGNDAIQNVPTDLEKYSVHPHTRDRLREIFLTEDNAAHKVGTYSHTTFSKFGQMIENQKNKLLMQNLLDVHAKVMERSTAPSSSAFSETNGKWTLEDVSLSGEELVAAQQAIQFHCIDGREDGVNEGTIGGGGAGYIGLALSAITTLVPDIDEKTLRTIMKDVIQSLGVKIYVHSDTHTEDHCPEKCGCGYLKRMVSDDQYEKYGLTEQSRRVLLSLLSDKEFTSDVNVLKGDHAEKTVTIISHNPSLETHTVRVGNHIEGNQQFLLHAHDFTVSLSPFISIVSQMMKRQGIVISYEDQEKLRSHMISQFTTNTGLIAAALASHLQAITVTFDKDTIVTA